MSSLEHRAPLSARSGASLVEWLSAEPEVRDHVVTDGRHSLAYVEVPPVLARLDALFSRHGVSRRHPLALECSQSVAGALALLHVLSRGYDVVLLPELSEGAKETKTPRFIPSFCAHTVTASAGHTSDSPEASVAVAANPAFTEDSMVASFAGPDLYLRTSGSTAGPKLARMSHQKWLNNALGCVDRWRLTADDRLSIPVPIFHSYGLGAAFLPGLLVGAAMDLAGGANVLRYVEREERFAPTVAFLTPAFCDMFLTVRKGEVAHRCRLSVTAGDKIKRETMAAFEPRFGPLLNLYGSAEMGAVSSAAAEDPPERRLATAGYPLAGIELRLAGASDPRAGLLQCRQRNGFAGYLVQDDGWRFEPHGDEDWFATGDLANLRDDGYLEILGRSGLSVKRDGLLVVFAEVEAAVEKIPGVRRAVVVAAGEGRRGPRLAAACLVEDDGLTAEALRRSCFDLLPRYAVPDDVVTVEALPKLPSGKVDRRAVRDLVLGLLA